MLRKISLVLATVRHLKLIQIKYQVLYRLKKAGALSDYCSDYNVAKLNTLTFNKVPTVYESWFGSNSFTFLNIEVDFKEEIDWDFQEHGKLWNYNLQYANYLLQDNIEAYKKVLLIKSLYDWLQSGRLPLEPYPASLRSINVIRFCCLHDINDPSILRSLHAELEFLSKRPEYHLLGNHLLENAFALIMGGTFFSESTWLKQGKVILTKQLSEQILSDGAHFELSPMYHQIVLFRLLELIDWYSKWDKKEEYFQTFLIYNAQRMRAWLEHLTFRNDDIPHFNDSSTGISYSTPWLSKYADELGVNKVNVPLGISGYRSVNKGVYECKVDFGQVGPSYQPGHAHADALSFILYSGNEPLMVERGTSTYQIGDIRSGERSTAAHNTVTVNGQNQSNVWGGFRVAERAKVKISKDSDNETSAQHDGYRKYGIIHKRSFLFRDDSIEITDIVKGKDELTKEFHLHFYPGLELSIKTNEVTILGKATILFDNPLDIRKETYDMADGYNQYKVGNKLVITFVDVLNTTIILNK